MHGQGEPRRSSLHPSLVLTSRILGLLTGLVGAAVFAGWMLDIAWLRDFTGDITMKTNAALATMLAGVALALLSEEQPGWARRWAGRSCAVVVLLVGSLTFSEHAFGWDLGIDQLLASERPGAAAVTSPNRMGPPASLSFSLLGAALLLLSRQGNPARRCTLGQPLVVLVALIGVLPTIGYLYGVKELFGIAQATGIAWITAVTLVALSIGVLCARPSEGLMAVVTADDPGGRIVRWLLVPVLLVPPALGWLALAGPKTGWYELEMGVALASVVSILLLGALVYYSGRRLSRVTTENERQRQLLAVTLASIGDGVIVTDMHGRVTFLNQEAERLTGWTNNDAFGKPLASVFHVISEDTREPVGNPVEKVLKLGSVVGLANHTILVAKDGREMPIHDSGAPIRSADGDVHGVVMVFRDFTERKRTEERSELRSEVTSRLLASDHPQQIVESLCRKVMAHLGCDALFNFLVDDEQNRLRLNACAGISEEIARQIEWLDIGAAVCGCVARDGRRIVAENIQTVPDPRTELVRSLGIQAYACHPLMNQGRVVGTLSFGSRVKTAFAEDELALMKTVTDDVAIAMQRVRLMESLERHARAADAASAAKSQFLANMSHELRTPMTSILGMTDLALEEELSSQVRDYLQTARNSADMLLAVVNEVLDFSRIEAGKLALESHPFRLRPLVEETIKVLGVRAQEKGLPLECEIAADVPDNLVGDFHRLRQILINLVGNAIKFTAEGKVVVRVAAQSRIDKDVCLGIVVEDTGIGIAQEQHRRIFEPFAQADASLSRQYGGAGLGLAIVSNLVRIMGGQIELKSESGKGSSFAFTVRLEIAGESQLVPARSLELGAIRRRLRVLLVEDTQANQKLIQRILEKRGHSVQIASNGREGIDLLGRYDFDIVLMDVQMPVMDGFQATRIMREMPNGKQRIPIIAMTAHAMKGDQERCLASGMDAYLAKPVDSRELIELLERWGNSSASQHG